MRARRFFGVGLLLLVALGFLLRLVPLGRYVTPDEPAWVERSIRFADALTMRDLVAVPSTGHPGVTTMWLGAAGVAARRWMSPAESDAHLDWVRQLAWLAPENGEAFGHLAFFLPAGRVAVALTNSLGLLATYWMLRRLFDRQVAFLAVGLLAFDPFLVGYSGLLHTDGLLATFSTLSLLSLLLAVRDGQGSGFWVVVSGITAGLALLTKSLGGYLVIVAAVVLGVSWLLGDLELVQSFRWLVLWGLAVAATYVVLYPAMWVAPLETIRDLLVAPSYQSTTALMPTFFAGRWALQHGPEFYAVALPFRLNPVVLIGLLLGAWMLVEGEAHKRDVAWLSLFSLGYVLILTLSVKRYQRYLLPTVGPLTIVAALSLLHRWRARPGTRGFRPYLAVCLQLLLLVPFALHPLTSLNPLLGGPWLGARLLSVDWGEGMGAAARWLNQRADAERLTVAAASVPSFASMFVGSTVPLEQTTRADYIVRDVPQASPSSLDYPVAYTATVGFVDHAVVFTSTESLEQAAYLSRRVAPGDLILLDADTPLLRRYKGPGQTFSVASLPDEQAIAQWLKGRIADAGSIWQVASPGASPITAAHLERRLQDIGAPVITATVADASVIQYVLDGSRPADSVSPHKATFGGRLTLVDGIVRPSAAWPDDLPVVLRWQASTPLPVDYRAVVTLRDSLGHAWDAVGTLIRNDVDFPTSAWLTEEWADTDYELSLPAGLPPGRYAVEVSVFDIGTGAALGANDADGAFLGTRVPIGDVSIKPATRSPAASELKVTEGLTITAGPLTLLGVDSSEQQVISGDFLSFSLVWQADRSTDVNYRLELQLVGPEGELAFKDIRPLSIYPTSRWRTGDRFRNYYDLHLPPDLAPGSYRLTVNVLGGQDLSLWEQDPILTTVEVLPQDRFFTLPREPQERLDLTFGEQIHLIGFDLAAGQVSPGDEVPLTLYWRANGPTDRPYSLFVHLRGSNGELHGQVDRAPGGGAAPTSRWAAGQVIVDDLALPVAAGAPSASYRIVIGFYDPAYGDRLPVIDASGELLSGNEAVLPFEVTVLGE